MYTYNISLVSFAWYQSSGLVLVMARVGIPAKALRTKLKYLSQCVRLRKAVYLKSNTDRQKSLRHAASRVIPRATCMYKDDKWVNQNEKYRHSAEYLDEIKLAPPDL